MSTTINQDDAELSEVCGTYEGGETVSSISSKEATSTVPLIEIPIPPEVKAEIDTVISGLKAFTEGLPDGAMPIRHVELILQALDFDPSPLDLQMLAAYTGSGSEDYILGDVYRCIEYFVKRKNNPNELLRAYREFDPTEKGFITLEDMRRASQAAREDMADIELRELIEVADPTNSRVVLKEEFFSYMKEVHFSLKEN